MKNDGNSGNENTDGLDARDDAALWDLLGRAEPPKAGPYFARRVLREVSLQADAPAAPWWQPAALWRACRRLPRVAFVAGTPVAALCLLFLGLHLNPSNRQTPLATPAAVTAPAAHSTAEASPALVSDGEIADSLAQDESTMAFLADEDDSTAPPAGNAPAPRPAPGAASSAVPESISEQDVEVIAELDTLLKREQNRLWTEDTARF